MNFCRFEPKSRWLAVAVVPSSSFTGNGVAGQKDAPAKSSKMGKKLQLLCLVEENLPVRPVVIIRNVVRDEQKNVQRLQKNHFVSAIALQIGPAKPPISFITLVIHQWEWSGWAKLPWCEPECYEFNQDVCWSTEHVSIGSSADSKSSPVSWIKSD